jgi:hypothetical protein
MKGSIEKLCVCIFAEVIAEECQTLAVLFSLFNGQRWFQPAVVITPAGTICKIDFYIRSFLLPST